MAPEEEIDNSPVALRDKLGDIHGAVPYEKRFDYLEASQYLRLAVPTVRKLVSRGFLSHYKLGKVVRFSRKDLDEFLESRHIQARAKR